MESYDLECSHERINVVPEPSEEIDFTDFLVCAEAEATQCLSSNYLKLLGEKRGKSPVEYFERFYILYHTLSNNRSKYKTERIPMFIWQACDDNAYDSTCWRFELIMSGWAAGLTHLNAAFESSTDQSRMSHLRSAHDIFRYACLECCRDWTRIDPLMMPFECTIGGCEFAVSLCKVLLQRTALSKRLLREWDNLDLPITLNTWLFEECKLLAQTCNLRRADGTATYLSQLAHHILMTFSTEAATSMLLCSAAEHMKTLTDQSDPVPHAKAHMLLRCAEAFLRSVDLQNMCSRHKKSYENLRSYADSLRDSCRSFVSANLSCSDLIGRYLDKSDEEPNLAWTFVTHKEARYYKQPSKRKEWYQCNADYAKSILINL